MRRAVLSLRDRDRRLFVKRVIVACFFTRGLGLLKQKFGLVCRWYEFYGKTAATGSKWNARFFEATGANTNRVTAARYFCEREFSGGVGGSASDFVDPDYCVGFGGDN